MKVLDCTLRDGGYLNDWNFSIPFGQAVYEHVSKAGASFVELGFLYPQSHHSGYFRKMNKEKVAEIKNGYMGAPICLMVDQGKCQPDLPPVDETDVDIIRVAVHKPNITDAIKTCQRIKEELGYETSLQMMNYRRYRFEEVVDLFDNKAQENVDYVSVADSFGSMMPPEVQRGITLLSGLGMTAGFHGHDNINMAFINSLEAVEAGAEIVDATLGGIGRGAGNLKLELLIGYYALTQQDYKIEPLLDLLDEYVDEFLTCGILERPEYVVSGLLNLHPNSVRQDRDNGLMYSDIWEKYIYE